MDAAQVIAAARDRAGLSLRALADAAGTSHATIAAYESGRKQPTVGTLNRVLAAAGARLEVGLTGELAPDERRGRGDELVAVLELAAQFPARHARRLDAPVFPRR